MYGRWIVLLNNITNMNDWTWNTQSVMATLNASCHSEWDRGEMDYYATPPSATKKLLENETFSKFILEPACGEGHISEVLKQNWHEVLSSDIVDRWYGDTLDYLNDMNFFESWHWDIITNPPFSKSQEFVEKSMDIIRDGQKVAMLLRIQFLEWVKRNAMFKEYPPKIIYVFSRNIRCAKNGDFKNATGNASTYCWFVWEKWFAGDPIIKWIL